jgi:hypothetical protein
MERIGQVLNTEKSLQKIDFWGMMALFVLFLSGCGTFGIIKTVMLLIK